MHKNQARANKNWEAKNKEYSNYIKSRSAARSFIKNKASLEDLVELRELLSVRELELKNTQSN